MQAGVLNFQKIVGLTLLLAFSSIFVKFQAFTDLTQISDIPDSLQPYSHIDIYTEEMFWLFPSINSHCLVNDSTVGGEGRQTNDEE